MSRCVAFLTLLVLTFVQEDSGFSCKKSNRNISKKQLNVLPLIDEVGKTVIQLLDDPVQKDRIQTFVQKAQTKICSQALDPTMISTVTKIMKDLQEQLKNGQLTKLHITAFLQDYPESAEHFINQFGK